MLPAAQRRQHAGGVAFRPVREEITGRHRGSNFVGKPMGVIVNLQMEGASGSPGPSGDTLYRARNLYVGRTNNG